MAMENADGRKSNKLKRSSEETFEVNEEVEVISNFLIEM